MLILDWEEFATLCPPGTIFSFLRKGYAYTESLCKKDQTIYHEPGKPADFTYYDLLPQEDGPTVQYTRPPDPITYSLETGPSDIKRWGEYDYEDQYIVFQEADLEILRNALKEAVPCR